MRQSRALTLRRVLTVALSGRDRASSAVPTLAPAAAAVHRSQRRVRAGDGAAIPTAQWPDYPRFLEGVRAHTQAGRHDRHHRSGDGVGGGYSYAYYRASYFLTGREVLPLVTPDERAPAAELPRREVHRRVRRRLASAGRCGVAGRAAVRC